MLSMFSCEPFFGAKMVKVSTAEQVKVSTAEQVEMSKKCLRQSGHKEMSHKYLLYNELERKNDKKCLRNY